MVKRDKPTTLCFAALIRVSTEQQAETGESLRTQRTEIESTVRQLGGTVTTWYGGQEHATPGWEKAEIKRLLGDASKKGRAWDAVIVSNADRWSRDNQASHDGLKVFREQEVRFFVGASEYDLYNPEHCLFLEMSAAFGGFQARNQNKKSILSRVHRARRGCPTGGKLPFGRTFDKQTGQWGIDTRKQRLIEDVARRYLAGQPMPQLADELGMNHSSLHKTLTKRCGDTWTLEFHSDELNIHETVDIAIPRLLPDETIKAVLAKVEANKTYTHGQIKNGYLLSRMVFCQACGYTMFGQTNHNEHQYYRHAHMKRERTCNASKSWVPAEALEDAVLRHMFNTFGNPAAVERAIEAAIPDLDAARDLQERIDRLDEAIDKEREGRQKVLRLVQRGLTSEDEASKLLQDSQQKTKRLQQERERLGAALTHVPTADEVKETARKVAGKFRRVSKAFVRANAAIGRANADFSRMSWEDKRDLLKRVFAGRTLDGQRMGVYIEWPKSKQIRYTIKGLIDRTGTLPASKVSLEALTDPDTAGAEQQNAVTSSAWH